jgi:hypothetical protein
MATLQADLVRPLVDGEHATAPAVMTPACKLENP